MPTIAVDALGGNSAPDAPVEAAATISKSMGLDVVLVGDLAQIEPALGRYSYSPERLRIHDSGGTGDAAAASVAATVALVASGQADAMVTAGSPPLALRACIAGFELAAGVRHAPLAAVYPTAPRPGNRDPFALILDVGATLRPTAEDMVAWAQMGAAYAGRISKVDAPTVGLLSIGRDPAVGPPEVVRAHDMLKDVPGLRFVGNIEGIDIPAGAADVVVTDGFTGQVLIGVLGGINEVIRQAARGAWEKHLRWRMGLRLLEGAVVRFSELIDHSSYGGAPLLGYDHVAILALPTSSAHSLSNAIRLAAKSVRNDIPAVVARALAEGAA